MDSETPAIHLSDIKFCDENEIFTSALSMKQQAI